MIINYLGIFLKIDSTTEEYWAEINCLRIASIVLQNMSKIFIQRLETPQLSKWPHAPAIIVYLCLSLKFVKGIYFIHEIIV